MCNSFQNNKDCKICYLESVESNVEREGILDLGKNKKIFWELNRKTIKALDGLINNISLQGYKKRHLW